ncbi:MAG: glycosyltransferase [Actinobacteria bacterium]|nr:MAG: glycosyltransferase [Actinomycetota bacterium]
MSSDSVQAVVVTHNRKALLLECLAGIACQTRPVSGVLVVDNASTDGTEAALEASGLGGRLPLDYLRLARNGGGAEGFHYGVRRALGSGADWIWLMDDDCEPAPDTLAALLASPQAADPDAVLLAPIVRSPEGDVLPLNRGWIRPRWFRSPLRGLSPEHYLREEVEVDHVSLVGPLVRTRTAALEDPPRRDFFIRYDDLEWVSRLRRHGRLWLLPGAEIVHKDPRPVAGVGPRALWLDLRRGHRFEDAWKVNYGLRNMVWCGRRDGYVTFARLLSYTAVAALLALALQRPRPLAVRLAVRYALDGWHGRFVNVPPDAWAELPRAHSPPRALHARALAYDREVDEPVRRLEGAVA